ncbi:MAG: hypothetical protein R3B07_37305, partial [Polyangiaceae bacterium]
AGAGICLTGECVQTRCGDEYTDRDAGEFCDDGQNGNDADGCTDDCQASCSKDTDCADQDLCNGEERCVNDVCVNGAAVVCNDSDPCTVDSCVSASGICSFQALDDGDSCGGGSICVGGSCSASRCGDGFVDASRGEECDDGKDGDDTDGCKDDCKFTCKTNADCTPTNRCQASTCNTTTHQCSAPTTITCDDQDACTVDSCNTATGCVFSFIDADHDGFAPNTCKAGGSYATKGGDCDDTNNNVFPGQTAYFTSKTAKGSWDYNCSSVDEKEFGAIYQPTGTVTVCSGWENSAPACGFSGTYVSRLRGSQGQCTCITGSCESTKTQACH